MTPAVELLEERRLLSHFSVPFSPAWGFPGGHGSAPPAFFATSPNRQERPFSSDQGAFQGRSPQRNDSPAPAAATAPNAAPSNAASPSNAPVQAAIPRAQPTDFVPEGQIAKSVDAQSNATTYAPVIPTADLPALAKAPDTAIGPASPAISGLPRSATLSMGFSAPEALFAPAWADQIKPLTREPITAWSATVGGIRELARRSPGSLPAPQGADLITNLAAFGQAPLRESLLRLFGRLGGSSEQSSEHHALNQAHLLLIALAVAALEALRRWRGRRIRTSGQSRRWRNSLLMGLPRSYR
jgi:hypothetical protein